MAAPNRVKSSGYWRKVKARSTISIIIAFISGSDMRDRLAQGISPYGVTTFTSLKSPIAEPGKAPAWRSSSCVLRTQVSTSASAIASSFCRSELVHVTSAIEPGWTLSFCLVGISDHNTMACRGGRGGQDVRDFHASVLLCGHTHTNGVKG